jgi:hypothetical protein
MLTKLVSLNTIGRRSAIAKSIFSTLKNLDVRDLPRAIAKLLNHLSVVVKMSRASASQTLYANLRQFSQSKNNSFIQAC